MVYHFTQKLQAESQRHIEQLQNELAQKNDSIQTLELHNQHQQHTIQTLESQIQVSSTFSIICVPMVSTFCPQEMQLKETQQREELQRKEAENERLKMELGNGENVR